MEINYTHNEIDFSKLPIGTEVCSISFGNGYIIGKNLSDNYPILIEFNDKNCIKKVRKFTLYGKENMIHTNRSLFLGHDVKIDIKEDVIKQICPYCKVHHAVERVNIDLSTRMWHFADTENKSCIFRYMLFNEKHQAEYAYDTILINIFEQN